MLSDVGVLWPNGWTDQDEACPAGRPQPWSHCVRWGPNSPSPKRGAPPKFSAHGYCGQTAGCIKMPLSMEVGLSPSMWTQLPPEKKAHPSHSIFGSCLLSPNGWMDEDASWCGSRPRPRPHCIRRGPSSPRKGHSSPPPVFGPCILWPRSSISATAELLLNKQ